MGIRNPYEGSVNLCNRPHRIFLHSCVKYYFTVNSLTVPPSLNLK